jgi:CspA family cold shock protein
VIATVREWKDDEGWGVLWAAEVPQGIWAHFSAIQINGYKALTPGDTVEVDVQGPLAFDQDGYRYRATAVRMIS